jgi:hypothetical protein
MLRRQIRSTPLLSLALPDAAQLRSAGWIPEDPAKWKPKRQTRDQMGLHHRNLYPEIEGTDPLVSNTGKRWFLETDTDIRGYNIEGNIKDWILIFAITFGIMWTVCVWDS